MRHRASSALRCATRALRAAQRVARAVRWPPPTSRTALDALVDVVRAQCRVFEAARGTTSLGVLAARAPRNALAQRTIDAVGATLCDLLRAAAGVSELDSADDIDRVAGSRVFLDVCTFVFKIYISCSTDFVARCID